jgi:hypothetical protein
LRGQAQRFLRSACLSAERTAQETLFMRAVAIAAIALAAFAGCGSGDETSSYRLIPVNGAVTHDGKPLEGAEITFSPHPSNNPLTPGMDTTAAGGTYKIQYRGRPGVAAGKYTVMISKALGSGAAESGSQPKGAPKPTTLEGSFPAEVSSGTGPLNFDIKGAGTSK